MFKRSFDSMSGLDRFLEVSIDFVINNMVLVKLFFLLQTLIALLFLRFSEKKYLTKLTAKRFFCMFLLRYNTEVNKEAILYKFSNN